jgi:hypothetical protein
MANPNWKKGMPSPQKSGRPRGALDRRQRLQKALAEDGSTLLDVATAKALAGDMQAMALLLPRLMPTLRSEGALCSFELDQSLSYEEQAKSVLAAVTCGQLDLDSAKTIMDMIVATLGFKDMDAFLKEREKARYPGGVKPMEE